MAKNITDDVQQYLNVLRVERQLSPHTVKAYEHDIQKLLSFCEAKSIFLWQGLSSHLMRQFAASMHAKGMSPKSIQRILSSGRILCNHLIKHQHLKNNPFDDVKAPKAQQRLPKTLSVDQVTNLVEINVNDPLSYRDKAVLELFYSSGLRLSELCNLNLNDLSIGEKLIRVTGKGNKTRDLPIGRHAIKALQEWILMRNGFPLKDYEEVFVSRQGRRINPRTIQQRVKYWAQKQGIEINVSPHMLRHSFASHLLESSGELRSVQELLGHANISTTQVYTHLDFQHLAQVYDDAHPRAKKSKK